MKIYDQNYQLLDISKIDLSKGNLLNTNRIKPDAEPIDNITKFAWADSDYEEIQVFIPFTPEQLAERNKPSELELLKVDIADIKTGIGNILKLLNGGK